jgi:hypothetical protein
VLSRDRNPDHLPPLPLPLHPLLPHHLPRHNRPPPGLRLKIMKKFSTLLNRGGQIFSFAGHIASLYVSRGPHFNQIRLHSCQKMTFASQIGPARGMLPPLSKKFVEIKLSDQFLAYQNTKKRQGRNEILIQSKCC